MLYIYTCIHVYIHLSVYLYLSIPIYLYLYVYMCAPDSCRRSPPKIGERKTSVVSVESVRGEFSTPPPYVAFQYTYISTHIHTIHTYVIYIYVYIYMYMHLSIYLYVSIPIYLDLYVNICAPGSCRRSPPKIGKGKTSLVSVESGRG